MSRRKRVLMVAYACEPSGTGEHLLGWGWAHSSLRYLTHSEYSSRHKPALRSAYGLPTSRVAVHPTTNQSKRNYNFDASQLWGQLSCRFFHIIKLMNEKKDQLRRPPQREATVMGRTASRVSVTSCYAAVKNSGAESRLAHLSAD
jgi:hypothetical protein